MITDGNTYKDRVSIIEQHLRLFKKSVEECNIPVMLDNSIQFLESTKNADNLYFGLPPKIKESDKDIHRKSHTLLVEYFNIKSRIGHFCECRSFPILKLSK